MSRLERALQTARSLGGEVMQRQDRDDLVDLAVVLAQVRALAAHARQARLPDTHHLTRSCLTDIVLGDLARLDGDPSS